MKGKAFLFKMYHSLRFAFIGIDLFPVLHLSPQSLHDVDEMLPLVRADSVYSKKGTLIGIKTV